MSYSGEILNQCGLIRIDCSQVAVVAVSGDGPNFCGHLLLHAGTGSDGLYFHIAGWYTYPHYMNETQYRRYLNESGKTEIRRRSVRLPNPSGARGYLEELSARKWLWALLPNNCVAFVEAVLNAGGSDWVSYSNCPEVATQESLESRVSRLLYKLEQEALWTGRLP